MWHALKLYGLLLPILFVLDYLWLGLLAADLYKRELAAFLRLDGDRLAPVIGAALVVYLAIPLGVVLFALPRVSTERWVLSALGWGALYGLILYSVYDMTNYALVKGWPLKLSLVDMAWGTVLNALATVAAALLDRWVR